MPQFSEAQKGMSLLLVALALAGCDRSWEPNAKVTQDPMEKCRLVIEGYMDGRPSALTAHIDGCKP